MMIFFFYEEVGGCFFWRKHWILCDDEKYVELHKRDEIETQKSRMKTVDTNLEEKKI